MGMMEICDDVGTTTLVRNTEVATIEGVQTSHACLISSTWMPVLDVGN